jgi:hypothetical protein
MVAAALGVGLKMLRGGGAGYAAHKAKNAIINKVGKANTGGQRVVRDKMLRLKGNPGFKNTAKNVYNRVKSAHANMRDPIHSIDRTIRSKLNPKLAGHGKLLQAHNALSYAMTAARGKTRR